MNEQQPIALNTAVPGLCPKCMTPLSMEQRRCPDDGSPLMALDKDPYIGTIIDNRYQVTGLLGVGKTGMIYSGWDTSLKRAVAIKILPQPLTLDSSAVKRFDRAARLGSAINHPNIAVLYDFGQASTTSHFFMVMELVKGTSLKRALVSGQKLSAKRVLDLFIPMCDALSTAHKRDIVLRNLKPSDLILTYNDAGDEMLKLVDFGLAIMLESGEQDPTVTTAGRAITTSSYASPEVLLAEPVDHRADICSLGYIMTECLTGKKPEPSGSLIMATTNQVRASQVIKRSLEQVGIPDELTVILSRASAKEPNRRFQSMLYLQEKLADIRAKLPAEPHTTTQQFPVMEPEQHKARPNTTIILHVLLVAVIAYLICTTIVALLQAP